MRASGNIGDWARRNQTALWLLAIILVGSVLRLYDLGAESIWLDEASGIRLSSKTLTETIAGAGPSQNHPPFYFILLHYQMGFFGTSETATRSLSAIFGIISIFLVYQVGSTLFNREVGLISSFLSATSCYHILYSQEARSYALLLLLSLISYLLFTKILKQDVKWYYPCYFLTNLLLGYTHFYGLFIIASQALFFILFWQKYRLQRYKFLSTLVLTILGLLPLVSLFGGRVIAIAESGFWIGEPELIDMLHSLAAFSGYCFAVFGEILVLLPLTFIALALFGFIAVTRLNGKLVWSKPVESLKGLTLKIGFKSIEEGLLLVLWLFFSIIVPFIESKFMTPIYLTRYMIGASPAFHILVAKGMNDLSRRRVLCCILIFIVFLSSLGLQHYYQTDMKSQWRDVANLVEREANVDTDAAIFCESYIQTPFDYYYKGEIRKVGIGKTVSDTQELATFVDDAIREKQRLWLILGHGGKKAPIHGYLVYKYGSEAILVEKQFRGALVILFDLPTP